MSKFLEDFAFTLYPNLAGCSRVLYFSSFRQAVQSVFRILVRFGRLYSPCSVLLFVPPFR